MALIKQFKATNVWKAFTLNSIVAALVIFIAMWVKGKLDKYTDKKGDNIDRTTTWQSIVVTLISTFAASFLAFTLMYFIFGYGGGQLVNTTNDYT